MSSDKIDSTEVGGFWDKLFYLIKLITGDVKVSTKGTLQSQIDEMSTKVDDCFTSVSDGKKAVASAITDKGVTTAQNAEFATMAANVRKIKTNPTLQAKAITLDTSKTTQTLTPDPGYDGLSQVKASITTQTKSVNLSTSQQVVKPDSGKVLSQVTVPAVTGSAGLKDVVTGKTFNSATAGIGKTGTLPDKRGTTVDAAAVNQDDTYTYFTVPTEAVYDAKSKLRTLSSNLKSNEITKISGNKINGGATLQEMCVLNCEGKSVIEFTPIGYGNYGNGIIALSVYGANTLNEAMHGNYNISCTDRELIQTINFNSGTKYSVNISGYKYVSFSAKNNNDAYAFVDLTHVQLSNVN